jgi:hypothetical protein
MIESSGTLCSRVFVSRLEEILSAEELTFSPTPGFGRWAQFFPEGARLHPARANLNLIEFLVLAFTGEGDIVLDPLAGSGSVGVVSALHGRNAVQVDVEPVFYHFMEAARERVEKAQTFSRKGWIRNFCADSRNLSKIILEHVNVCITSPPYGETYLGGGDPERRRERLIRSGHDPRDFLGGKARNAILKHYSDVGAGLSLNGLQSGSSRQDNVGNLPLGDVGELEAGIRECGLDKVCDASERERLLEKLYCRLTRNGRPSYLSEMLKIYAEVWKVLVSGGRMIVIIKPFQRGGQVVDLPYYTHLLTLCNGFSLEKVYKLRLKQLSLWRILAYRRNPSVPRILHEYVLVCRKT